MTKLNKLYYIKLEIDDIRSEIDNIPEISSSQMTGMPHSTTISDPVSNVFMKKQKLVDKLSKKIDKYLDELNKVEDFIDEIEDEEIRTIARKRFIKHKKWEEIGKEMDFDRTVCYKKLKNYFKRNKIEW